MHDLEKCESVRCYCYVTVTEMCHISFTWRGEVIHHVRQIKSRQVDVQLSASGNSVWQLMTIATAAHYPVIKDLTSLTLLIMPHWSRVVCDHRRFTYSPGYTVMPLQYVKTLICVSEITLSTERKVVIEE